MKRILCMIVILFCMALVQPGLAQTFTYSHVIDVTGIGDIPTGIAYNDGKIYTVTFNDRKLIEITDPQNSVLASASVLADASGLTTWPADRGMNGVSVDPVSDDIFATGDPGTGAAVFRFSAAGALVASLTDANGGHRASGCTIWGSTPNLLACQTNYALFNIHGDLSGFMGYNSLGVNLYYRDVVLVGDDFYTAYTNGSTTDGIVKATGGTPDNGLAGYTGSNWLSLASGTWTAACGIGYWDNSGAGTEYLIFANQVDHTVDFYDLADTSKDIVLDATSGNGGGMTDPNDAVVAMIGGSEYLFVTNGMSNEIYVFTGPNSVDEWDKY